MNFIMILIPLLISVAFYTMLERKILSYIQMRKGPNKVGFMGLLQPFSDAIKLFNKTLVKTETMNYFFSYTMPATALIINMIMWPLMPYMNFTLTDNNYNILTFLILSSITVYTILLIGWSANSKFCHLGAMRSIAQMISYEITFFLIILSIIIMTMSYNFSILTKMQMYTWFMMGMSITMIMWLISSLAEVNRTPFDFAEGESELVSGFNVEYMGGWFALIFLAEYANMLILSLITYLLFVGKMTTPISILSIIMISTIFLWLRGTLPRFRYDLLMMLNWKIFLPSTMMIMPTMMAIMTI